eukprot:m.740022 g.740022  ORF g.740022 m.740022 type:complete len:419 (-) comp23111_c0_seq8:597-1853(-)
MQAGVARTAAATANESQRSQLLHSMNPNVSKTIVARYRTFAVGFFPVFAVAFALGFLTSLAVGFFLGLDFAFALITFPVSSASSSIISLSPSLAVLLSSAAVLSPLSLGALAPFPVPTCFLADDMDPCFPLDLGLDLGLSPVDLDVALVAFGLLFGLPLLALVVEVDVLGLDLEFPEPNFPAPLVLLDAVLHFLDTSFGPDIEFADFDGDEGFFLAFGLEAVWSVFLLTIFFFLGPDAVEPSPLESLPFRLRLLALLAFGFLFPCDCVGFTGLSFEDLAGFAVPLDCFWAPSELFDLVVANAVPDGTFLVPCVFAFPPFSTALRLPFVPFEVEVPCADELRFFVSPMFRRACIDPGESPVSTAQPASSRSTGPQHTKYPLCTVFASMSRSSTSSSSMKSSSVSYLVSSSLAERLQYRF